MRERSCACVQCVAKTENGKRTVAGVCWDYDCYGAPCSCPCLPHRAPTSNLAHTRARWLMVGVCTMSDPSAYTICRLVPGGTLKKQLGEPTMMPDWEKDAAAGKLILERAGLEVFHSPLHLEGGSIHTDGEGCASGLLVAYKGV